MTYDTLNQARAAQANLAWRDQLHYVKLPSGKWCVTLGPPGDNDLTTVRATGARTWQATRTSLAEAYAQAGV